MSGYDPDQDDLISVLERFKDGLESRSTGGQMEDVEYRRLRKIILSHPWLREHAPDFVRTCRTIWDYWSFIKEKFSTYQERRDYLRDELNPLISDLETGQALDLSNLEKIEQIGRGGFGEVWRYRHRLLGIDFALKVLAPAFGQGGEVALSRFFREARILFQLQHPNIIRIYDVGLMGRQPFIRMELFEGRNLNQLLTEFGRLEPAKATVMALRICEALEHAHDAGVLHRDLKPSNILLARKEQLRVIDFGLGVFVEDELVSRLTRTGEQAAGGIYTAPELVAEPRRLDPRSDLYSLGALWYAALTGRGPAGSGIEETLAHEIPELPSEYQGVLLRCLAHVDARWSSSGELLEAIRGLLPEQP